MRDDRIEPQSVDVDAQTTGEGVEGGLHGIPVRHPLAVVSFDSAVGALHRCLREREEWGPITGDVERGIRVVAGLGAVRGRVWGPGLDHRHAVHRERAGLVSADERRRAECFHRFQVTDEDLPLGHLLGTPGEGQRDGGQQRLGDQGHGDADREDERI